MPRLPGRTHDLAASRIPRPARPGLYSEQERATLALTDAMTLLPQAQDVPDDVYGQATAIFSEDQYRAVTWAITVINAFNRLAVTSGKPLPAAAELSGPHSLTSVECVQFLPAQMTPPGGWRLLRAA
jgi:alkylhydroperoxidase family enzyme